MTPHTPLIEALKAARKSLRDIYDAVSPATAVPSKFDQSAIIEQIDEALRIATETTEPDAAQSIRAEALEEAAKLSETQAKLFHQCNRPGTANEFSNFATAIRSLGDRG